MHFSGFFIECILFQKVLLRTLFAGMRSPLMSLIILFLLMECPCVAQGHSHMCSLELDINLFAVEDLIYSGISPCKELLVEVEEVDHEECSCCDAEDLDDQLHRFE